MRYRLLLTVAAITAGIDLLTKAIAVALFTHTVAHLPGHWRLHVMRNHGVIFGIGAGTRLPDIFAILVVIQLTVLLWVNRRQRSPARAVEIGLLAGAAIGNVGESRLSGYVVDWIRPPHLPIVFDLADLACVCGQVLLIALTVHVHVSRTRASGVRTQAAVSR